MWKTRQNYKELNCREKRSKSSQKWTVMALKLCRKCEDLHDENVSNGPKITFRCHFGNVAGSSLFLMGVLRALYGLTIYFYRVKIGS